MESAWDIITWGSAPYDFRWLIGDLFVLLPIYAFGYLIVMWVKRAWQDYRKYGRSYNPSGQ